MYRYERYAYRLWSRNLYGHLAYGSEVAKYVEATRATNDDRTGPLVDHRPPLGVKVDAIRAAFSVQLTLQRVFSPGEGGGTVERLPTSRASNIRTIIGLWT